jgi:hypothetical protein
MLDRKSETKELVKESLYIDVSETPTRSMLVRREAKNFKKAFIFMQIYILLNLCYNICSKFL